MALTRLLKNGTRGRDVKSIQLLLKKLGYEIIVDGVFGSGTERTVRLFQSDAGLVVDGLIGRNTYKRLQEVVAKHIPQVAEAYRNLFKGFRLFMAAGHGGYFNGQYVTKQNGGGKFAFHQGRQLHINSMFAEGMWNRQVAVEAEKLAVAEGLLSYTVSHPYKDLPLSEQALTINEMLALGAYGFLVNIHSNASSSPNTRGLSMWTKKGIDDGEFLMEQNLNQVKRILPDMPILDSYKPDAHYESNFYMVRYPNLPAYFLEVDFFTSPEAVAYLLQPRVIKGVAESIIETAFWAKDKINSKNEIIL